MCFNCWYSSTNRSVVLFVKTSDLLMHLSFFFVLKLPIKRPSIFERPFLTEAFCRQTALGHQSLPVCGTAVLIISCYKCINCIRIFNQVNSGKLINLGERAHFDSPPFYVCQIIKFCSPDSEYVSSGMLTVQSAVWNISL